MGCVRIGRVWYFTQRYFEKGIKKPDDSRERESIGRVRKIEGDARRRYDHSGPEAGISPFSNATNASDSRGTNYPGTGRFASGL
jgi:hypothetical protein